MSTSRLMNEIMNYFADIAIGFKNKIELTIYSEYMTNYTGALYNIRDDFLKYVRKFLITDNEKYTFDNLCQLSDSNSYDNLRNERENATDDQKLTESEKRRRELFPLDGFNLGFHEAVKKVHRVLTQYKIYRDDNTLLEILCKFMFVKTIYDRNFGEEGRYWNGVSLEWMGYDSQSHDIGKYLNNINQRKYTNDKFVQCIKSMKRYV